MDGLWMKGGLATRMEMWAVMELQEHDMGDGDGYVPVSMSEQKLS